MTKQFDLTVIGAGIVGLATAFNFLKKFPEKSVLVLEKEGQIAQHQSGHNSGVIHAGTYYKPGSLKATNCRLGKSAMLSFCEAEGIQYRICGKVIVAVDQTELRKLNDIFERGKANGVQCRLISNSELREREPHVRGVSAILVDEEGVVDFKEVCRALRARICASGGSCSVATALQSAQSDNHGVVLETSQGEFRTQLVANCAGLHADRVARMFGHEPSVQIVPFRGEYYELRESAQHFCRSLIYPVPHPDFPFLGVHFTRTIHGKVKCGPNAVLALAREGYTKGSLSIRDLFETIRYDGFRKLAKRYWKEGTQEIWRSYSKAAFVRSLQRLIPEVQSQDFVKGPTGVRAQAVSKEGVVVDDFIFEKQGRILHVLNAPSPAATASLNIGRVIVDALSPMIT